MGTILRGTAVMRLATSSSLLLLLFACPVWGATNLERYFTCSEAATAFSTDDTFSTYLTVTVDRSGEAGAKDFIFIGDMSGEVTNLNTFGHTRLRRTSGTPATLQAFLTDQTFGHTDTDGSQSFHGAPLFFLEEQNLSNASHTFTLEATRSGGTK